MRTWNGNDYEVARWLLLNSFNAPIDIREAALAIIEEIVGRDAVALNNSDEE